MNKRERWWTPPILRAFQGTCLRILLSSCCLNRGCFSWWVMPLSSWPEWRIPSIIWSDQSAPASLFALLTFEFYQKSLSSFEFHSKKINGFQSEHSCDVYQSAQERMLEHISVLVFKINLKFRCWWGSRGDLYICAPALTSPFRDDWSSSCPETGLLTSPSGSPGL